MKPIEIIAEWDDEAGVWFATSTEIDGLALESESFDSLMQRLPGALLDLVELNNVGIPGADIAYHVSASHSGHIARLRA